MMNLDIVLTRDKNGTPLVNIPHVLVHHSPDGFEWGYGGSGPSDLALNILYAVTEDRTFSEAHHQDFKWEYVANIPYEGGKICLEEVKAYVEKIQEKERNISPLDWRTK